MLVAADHLTRSAEQGYPMFFARAATLQAISPERRARLQSKSQGPPLGQAEAEERSLANEKTRRGLNRPGGLSLEFLPVLI